jgi:glycosyltransferase involved in cell wall biosynthesis
VWPHVARASVVLAPLLAPGGTRFKILEGLMAGRPVVSTPAAADGLEDLEGNGLLLGEEPAAFAAAVVRLLDDPELATKLGRTGREAVLDRYTWSASQRRLLDLYDEHMDLR